MNIELTQNEARIIGCLMEKSVTTPDQYPLTLNALTSACNQKSSRNPVLALDPGTVQHTVRQLSDKHLLSTDENFKSRIEKYQQRFCNTPFAELHFSEEEFALICVLLLRGPQTPGELRTRTNRLCALPDNQAVTDVLRSLMEREGGPLVSRLPRTPGRQDHEYAHLFCGEIESVELQDAPVRQASVGPSTSERIAALEARVATLEQALDIRPGHEDGSQDELFPSEQDEPEAP